MAHSSLRQIKSRIRSIQNTKKLMRAMEMVSAAKLRRVESVLLTYREYSREFNAILKNLLLTNSESLTHPFFEKRPDNKKSALLVITSDSGLCSTYNNRLIEAAEDFMEQNNSKEYQLIIVGRKGFNYFKKRNVKTVHSYVGLNGRYVPATILEITKRLSGMFLNHEVGDVYMVYTQYVNKIRSKSVVEKFLNIEVPAEQSKGFLVEPGPEEVLENILPLSLHLKIAQALLEAFTSEHSTRMMTMRLAGDNAQDLLDSLILMRNKARQTMITKEIIEVTSTVEALKAS